jgi:hypothetical protein
VNSIRFLALISKGNYLQKDDFQALVKLHETFPYFPIPKILAAKYELEKTHGQSKELLHWASVQSPDRAWLKKLIEHPIEFLPQAAPEPPEKPTAGEGNKETGNTEEPEEPAKEKEEPPPHYNRTEILKKLEDNLYKFRQSAKQPEEEKKDANPEKPELRKSPAGEDLIEAIKKKEKKVILDARKIEQNDIIKAFSEKKINLTISRNEEPEQLADLSEESTEFNDKLISESFAKLLSKQGKKDKAIEIYQKLILKFPDKSAYFADLIKKLED